MKKFILIILLLAPVLGYGQAVTWSRWYDYNHLDNEGLDVIQTFDGGYLFLVNNYVPLNYSTLLIKTNLMGDVEWEKLFDRNNTGGANIRSYGVQQSKDSGFVFCGDSQSDSAFFIKTDRFGNLLWVKKYTRPGFEARFFGLSLTKDGGIIGCGDLYFPFKGYLVKTDSIGNLQWDALFESRGYSVIQSSDSNYYVTDLNYVYKFTSSGKFIWQSDFIIGSGGLGGSSIVEYSLNSIYAGGGLDSMVLNKIDSSGSLIWQKGYYTESMGFLAMCLSRDGNLLLAGEVDTLLQFDVSVAKVTPGGDLIYSKRLNLISKGSYGNYPNAVSSTSDSGFIFTGFTNFPAFTARDNVLAIKTDGNCNAPKLVSISNATMNQPYNFILYQNYPNPFNPTTNISYSLNQTSDIQLIVYDITGREIQILLNEIQSPGDYSVTFNAEAFNLASGIYFYKLTTGKYYSTRKMIVTK